MINWAFFPLSEKPTGIANQIVDVFEKNSLLISSDLHEIQFSNDVLIKLSKDLIDIGFKVELSKKKIDKIYMPVLFGMNGKVEKAFEADAFHPGEKFVIEIEAGRGVTNYQFLKDLFQACMMQNVDYLCIAVRKSYKKNPDFQKVFTFLDTLYKSNQLQLPLKGILIIGY